MSAAIDVQPVRMLPIDQIEVLNTRERNGRAFGEIVTNIKTIGLKKPIVVTPRPKSNGSDHYLLICGEGRLNAFRTLGEQEIPALVVTATDEDAFIMSLSENIARRQRRPLELLAGVEELRTRGYTAKQIATKTGLAPKYVQGILTLLQQGEQRLVEAVEKGVIPLNAALSIVGAGKDGAAVQAVLLEAYEAGTLRGRRLIDARRVMERRDSLGGTLDRRAPRKMGDVTSSSLVRTYQREVDRQKALVRKAGFTQQHLMFMVTALRQLFLDENFTNLLRAEGLDTLPKFVDERVWTKGRRP
jgi:ParB family chromosome partitioning protein